MFPHYQPKNKKIPASIPGGNQPQKKEENRALSLFGLECKAWDKLLNHRISPSRS